MLISELLTETTADDAFINHIATVITSQLRDSGSPFHHRVVTYMARPQVTDIGNLRTITGLEGSTDRERALLGVTVQLRDLSSRRARGGYHDGVLYVDPMLTLGDTSVSPPQPMDPRNRAVTFGSTVAHELRHALDDIVSQGRFHQRHGRGPTAYRGQDQHHDREYSNRPLEIHARYVQAVREVLATLSRAQQNTTQPATNSEIQRHILSAFRIHHITDQFPSVSDPNYQRLLKRAWQFVQHHL